MPRRIKNWHYAANLRVGERFYFAGLECIIVNIRPSEVENHHVINFIPAMDIVGNDVECSVSLPSSLPMDIFKL